MDVIDLAAAWKQFKSQSSNVTQHPRTNSAAGLTPCNRPLIKPDGCINETVSATMHAMQAPCCGTVTGYHVSREYIPIC